MGEEEYRPRRVADRPERTVPEEATPTRTSWESKKRPPIDWSQYITRGLLIGFGIAAMGGIAYFVYRIAQSYS